MTQRQARRRPVRIQSLARASALLDALAAANGGWVSLAGLSEAVQLQKTTVHNLLSSLVALEFVEQDDETRRYRLGLRNLELGSIVFLQQELPDHARPSLIRLSARTNETVSLAVPHGLDVLVVDSFEGGHGVRVAAFPGTRLSYHSSACGKSILAHVPRRERRVILDARPLVAKTPMTIQEIDVLEAELEQVRVRGFATNIEENDFGSVCVAAPIFGPLGRIVGAISVDAPSWRLTTDMIEDVGASVRAEAGIVSAAFGGRAGDDRQADDRDSPAAGISALGAPS